MQAERKVVVAFKYALDDGWTSAVTRQAKSSLSLSQGRMGILAYSRVASGAWPDVLVRTVVQLRSIQHS